MKKCNGLDWWVYYDCHGELVAFGHTKDYPKPEDFLMKKIGLNEETAKEIASCWKRNGNMSCALVLDKNYTGAEMMKLKMESM